MPSRRAERPCCSPPTPPAKGSIFRPLVAWSSTLELPWNPMRLEQRIGRVDRIGQHRTVHAVHLVASGTGETRILQRLRARVAQADRDVGACDSLGPMIGSTEAEEDATSRLVVNNDVSEATRSIVVPGADASLTFVRLTTEAAAEHTRLTRPASLCFRARCLTLTCTRCPRPSQHRRCCGACHAQGAPFLRSRAEEPCYGRSETARLSSYKPLRGRLRTLASPHM